MRFLVDANVSPAVAHRLRLVGHDAVAVRETGLQNADDDTILDAALADDRVVVSHSSPRTPSSQPGSPWLAMPSLATSHSTV